MINLFLSLPLSIDELFMLEAKEIEAKLKKVINNPYQVAAILADIESIQSEQIIQVVELNETMDLSGSDNGGTKIKQKRDRSKWFKKQEAKEVDLKDFKYFEFFDELPNKMPSLKPVDGGDDLYSIVCGIIKKQRSILTSNQWEAIALAVAFKYPELREKKYSGIVSIF